MKSEIFNILTCKDGRKIFVRKIQNTDTENIKQFFNSLSEKSKELFHPHITNDEEINKHIHRSVSGSDLSYLAFYNDSCIGYFFLWFLNESMPMLGIGIADEWQNTGLGQMFIDILIHDGSRLGKDGILLTTMSDNDRAFHVYQKKGFIYIGDKKCLYDGIELTERCMCLPLKDGVSLPDVVRFEFYTD
jgi:RimJ/RimL family protein N-acetyltransferase